MSLFWFWSNLFSILLWAWSNYWPYDNLMKGMTFPSGKYTGREGCTQSCDLMPIYTHTTVLVCVYHVTKSSGCCPFVKVFNGTKKDSCNQCIDRRGARRVLCVCVCVCVYKRERPSVIHCWSQMNEMCVNAHLQWLTLQQCVGDCMADAANLKK